MKELTALPNIGKKIAANLIEIGVHNKQDLQKMGSLKAWQRIRHNYPNKDICICALYALEGALQGLRWHELPPPLKALLQEKAKTIYK
ncbi:TfoX/Sxy family protein [Patescibacteria group bacterium]|nr:TfoX/Sxy family protein [Patescibacteria group bacterium]